MLGVALDEFRMKREFPMLANFETLIQLTRWDVDREELFLSEMHTIEGQKILKVNFLPDIFTTLS